MHNTCFFSGSRDDVLRGLKPANSNPWVHIACHVSTEDAFLNDKTAVHVQQKLKKNMRELVKDEKVSGRSPKVLFWSGTCVLCVNTRLASY